MAALACKHRMARRLVLLVRHGQYEVQAGDRGGLTAVGHEQAERTAELLSGYAVDRAQVSSLRRAKETAAAFEARSGVRFRAAAALREGFPTKVPGRKGVLVERERLDRAFDAVMRPGRAQRSVSLVVCHGNVIRYFVCRALRMPASRWLSLGTHHASVTRLLVQSDGTMGLLSFNEVAHLPARLIT